jgi:signal transduction histidine kinase
VIRLLGDISHDIKNLLSPVVCGAGLLESEINELVDRLPEIEADQAQASHEFCDEIIAMLRDTAARIQDRTKQIADYMKGLSTPPQFASCQIATIVDNVFKTLRLMAEQRGIKLRSVDLAGLSPILADERLLYNVFYNLINNAISEVPSGGSITVGGKEEPRSGDLLLAVIDTGRGIPPEVQETLFTDRAISLKPGGTGLGTRIVKDAITVHGGEITVESELGAGTTFAIRLPRKPPGAAQRRSPSTKALDDLR